MQLPVAFGFALWVGEVRRCFNITKTEGSQTEYYHGDMPVDLPITAAHRA